MNAMVTAHNKVPQGRTHLRTTTRACIKLFYGILLGLHEPTNGPFEDQTVTNMAVVVPKDLYSPYTTLSHFDKCDRLQNDAYRVLRYLFPNLT